MLRNESKTTTRRPRAFSLGVAAALVVDAERAAVLGRPIEIQITDARERRALPQTPSTPRELSVCFRYLPPAP